MKSTLTKIRELVKLTAGEKLYHGTSMEAAEYILQNGFGTSTRFRGMEPGVSSEMKSFTYLTPSKAGATWYATSNFNVKNPAVIEVSLNGNILWLQGKMEKYGAMNQAIRELGGEHNESMVDIPKTLKYLKQNGYIAIGFNDKDSGGKKAVMVVEPNKIDFKRIIIPKSK